MNIFDTLLKIFDKLFNNLENLMFNVAHSLLLGEIIGAVLTLIIILWCVKLIKSGEFHFPKDVINVVVFLLLTSFISYSLNNKAFLNEITSYLDIPSNLLQKFILQIVDNTNEKQTVGFLLENMLNRVINNYYVFIPEFSLFNIGANLLIALLLWIIYAFFSFILIASITTTIILNYLQIAFWKSFAVIMLPLLYFKITRSMVIFWGKTIIALSIISSFMIVIGTLSNYIENSLGDTMYIKDTDNKVSLILLTSFIIAKIICITFLKEIPSMINGMFQTNASNNAGAFANSSMMASIGAGSVASAYGAFKGAIMAGKGISNISSSIGAGLTNGVMKDIGSNIKKGIGNIIKR